jgi:DNA repair protein RecO (recombination protein O)
LYWTDEGFVLSARPHGETSLLVHLLTPHHGRHAGLVRGGRAARTRAACEVGSRVAAVWTARLAEHLGHLRCELLRSVAAALIEDPARLACLAAAAAVADAALPERVPHPRAFEGFAAVIGALEADVDWAAAYVRWEVELLAELGFGLDLESCAATGSTEDLAFVSPKSGRAVSAGVGAPFREKLLPLPRFLHRGGVAEARDVADGLTLTGYFLSRHVFAPQDRAPPPARGRFVDRIAS